MLRFCDVPPSFTWLYRPLAFVICVGKKGGAITAIRAVLRHENGGTPNEILSKMQQSRHSQLITWKTGVLIMRILCKKDCQIFNLKIWWAN